MCRWKTSRLLALALASLIAAVLAGPALAGQTGEELVTVPATSVEDCIDASRISLAGTVGIGDPTDPDDPVLRKKKCKYTVSNVVKSDDCRECPVADGDVLCGEACTQNSDCPGDWNGRFDCEGGGHCTFKANFNGCTTCP